MIEYPFREFVGVAEDGEDFAHRIDGLTNFKSFQSYCEQENKAWYSGQPAVLRSFYFKPYALVTGFNPGQNYFWKNVRGAVSMVHLPIASSVTELMANIIFGRLPKISADTPNRTNNARYDKRIQSLLDFNDESKMLQTASQLESYSGTVAGKIVVDSKFDAPIVQWYPAEKIKVHTKYGRVVEVCFKDTLIKDRETYTFKTIAGYGYIRYELWKRGAKTDETVPLSTLEETKDLHDMTFVDELGRPLKTLMCVFKQNRVANNIFNTAKGSSDYEGLSSTFDSIDETASAMVDVIKKSRTYTFIPEKMLAKDEDGNVAPNKAYGLDVWDVGKVSEEAEKLPQRDYVPIQVTPYLDAIKQLTKAVLNRVGISPSTFGYDDAGANASGEALNIRDEKTEKTYKDKSNLWKPALETLARLLLIFDEVLHNPTMKSGDYVVSDKLASLPITVVFPPYKELTPSAKFEKWMTMLENGAMSTEYAMRDALTDEIPDADIDDIQKQLGMVADESQTAEPTEINVTAKSEN